MTTLDAELKFRLPQAQRKELEQRARELDRDVSWLVRLAVTSLLETLRDGKEATPRVRA